MKIWIIILAILPVVGFIRWIYIKDKYEKEPPLKLLKYFILGIIVSILAIFIEGFLIKLDMFNGMLSNLYVAFFVAGFTEEGLKAVMLIPILLREKDFNEKLDGIIYSVFLSLGVATIENILYLMREKCETSFELGLSRGLISIPAHIMFAITMGYYISKYKFEENDDIKNKYIVKSVLIPILLHGIFDFILMIATRWAIIIFIVYVIFLWKINLDKLDKFTLYSKIRYYKKKYKDKKGRKIK
ncbi:MAG: PrsW family intramembrane metalloprotease [Terrisporobacter sp.]|uniref:PrsW family intramembrane metalloprotease n=1 Tax=Terrisporobacter sp. TaxID=1965305 RepID=UPI002FCC1E86